MNGKTSKKISVGEYEFTLIAEGFPTDDPDSEGMVESCLNFASLAVQKQPKRRLRAVCSALDGVFPTREQDEAFDTVQLAVDKAVLKVFKSTKKIAYRKQPTPQVFVEPVRNSGSGDH